VYVPMEDGMPVVREGGGSLGITRDCVLVSELCELFLVWLLDRVEDSVTPKSSTNLLPLFLGSKLVKEYISGFSSEVSAGVGGRRRLVRWKSRLNRSIQPRRMDARKSRTKISMPISCSH
jgi:hypothetical protein